MSLKTKTTLGIATSCAILWNILMLNVSAYAQLKADFTPGKTSDCESLITKFVDNSSGNPVSWKWDFGNGFTSTDQSPSAAYTSPGVYKVTLTVKNATGNTSAATKTVTVWEKPKPDFTAGPATGCMPLNVSFTDKSDPVDGKITTYTWDFGDGTVGTGKSPVHTYNNVLSPTVTLTVTNSNGCTASKRISNLVNVSAALLPDFSLSDQFLCTVPGTLTIKNTTTGPGNLSYKWDLGDGTIVTEKNPSAHNYTKKGTYQVKLTVTSDKGCIADKTSEAVNVANFTSDFQLPAKVCENNFATITVKNTPQADKVSWSVDKGTITGDGVNAYFFPAGIGIAKITMTADYGKCQEKITKDINIIAAPKAAFVSEIKPICDAPVTVKLTNKSEGANSWNWDFGDGQTSTQQNPTVTYKSLGSFNIKLTANSSSGCAITTENTVTLAKPEVYAFASVPEGCIGLTTTFSSYVSNGDSIISYEWDLGDGSPKSAAANPTHTYSNEGTYPVSLTYVTKNGCKGTVSLHSYNAIRVYKRPKPDFSSPEAPEICGNNMVHFKGTTDVGDSWTWDFGDNTGAGYSQNTQHSYRKPGTFTVSLTVSNFSCSEKVTKTAYITAITPFARFSLQSIDCNNRTELRFDEKSLGNITSWKWSWGDGKEESYTTKSKLVKHIYAKTGTYKVKLTVSDGNCTSTDSMNVKVYAPSSITIAADKTTLCGSDTLTPEITAISKEIYGLNVWNYSWTSSDGTPANWYGNNYRNITFTNLQPGVDTIRFIAYNLQGCPDTSNRVIVKVHGPVAKFALPTVPECRGSELTFTDKTDVTKGKPIKTWLWEFGDGTPAREYTAPPFRYTYERSGVFYPKLTVTDQDGCMSTASGPHLQVNGPNADFVPNLSLIPPGGDIQFFNYTTVTGGTPSYHWDFGNQATSTEYSPKQNFPNKGLYTIKLLVKDNNGCSDSAKKQIKVSTVSADFTVTTAFVNNSGCPPVIARFTNKSINYASAYWDFGDGSFSTISNPSHTYTYAGIYKVKLKVTGEAGNEDIFEQNVEVKGPYGTITTSSNGGCMTKEIEFKVSAVAAVNFAWDFTDGIVTETTDSTIKHTFRNPGIYKPRLILSDEAGCKGSAFLDDPIVIDKLDVSMTPSTQLVCDEGWVSFQPKLNSFSVDELKKEAKYEWTYDKGVKAENERTPNARFYVDKTQTYQFTFTTTTAYGCTQTVSDSVFVRPKPAATIIGPSQACLNVPVSFEGQINQSEVVTWNWSFSNNNTANLQQPAEQVYNQTGTSETRLIVKSENGCIDTAYHNIQILPIPVINASAGSNMLCLGAGTTLNASGGVTYRWSSSDKLSDTTSATLQVKPSRNTTYNVIVTDANGCVNTDEVSIRVVQPFNMTASKDTAICLGEQLQLWVSGADKYVWNGQGLDNYSSAMPYATITAAGKYIYNVSGQDADGCFTVDTSLTVTVHAPPVVDAGSDQVVMAGKPVILGGNSSTDIVKWNWSPSQYLNCATCPSPEALPNLSTTFTVEAENIYGCKATDEVFVKITCDQGAIFLPTAFSPNRDGKNEWFYPKGRGVKEVVSMRIFDRWGSLVFERAHFQINTATAGWDGTWKNEIAPIGSYVYAVETMCEDGGKFMFTGAVTIIR
ncbi:PKD domain-containing protein [Chitinophaga rhizophila]|uniref:PKD domain-containing protein n=1 Tax=Chitinophaga rhizophila TaxID=2866212 RepID=A0ABS7GAL6_9BACT|nr:PKD domain-containing protein [Chitinophaga rhizophila]MBW8683578.1 PKD domain-containing protein [Chitinophaga rhizophila]